MDEKTPLTKACILRLFDYQRTVIALDVLRDMESVYFAALYINVDFKSLPMTLFCLTGQRMDACAISEAWTVKSLQVHLKRCLSPEIGLMTGLEGNMAVGELMWMCYKDQVDEAMELGTARYFTRVGMAGMWKDMQPSVYRMLDAWGKDANTPK